MKRYTWLLIPAAVVAVVLSQRSEPNEPVPQHAGMNAPASPSVEEADEIFRREARIAAQKQKEQRIKSAIAMLSAQGISEDDLKEHFREEIEEEVKDEMSCSSPDDAGDASQDDNRYYPR